MATKKSVMERKVQLDEYVDRYQQRRDAAERDYERAQKVAQKALEEKERQDEIYRQIDAADREKLALVRADLVRAEAELAEAQKAEEQARNKLQSADTDLADAKSYADRELAKYEKQEQRDQKKADKQADREADDSNKTVLQKAASTAKFAGAVALGGAAVGVMKLKGLADTTRLMANNTSSYIAMTFAATVLGYQDRMPHDPTRKSWDPYLKRSKKSNHPVPQDQQPSFI